MQDNLIEFNKKVEIIDKEYSIYRDLEKGVIFPLNTIKLISSLECLELPKEEYNKLKFEKKIEDLEYNIVEKEIPQSKYLLTKKEEDKYTIVDAKVKVRQVYKVSNGIGIYKCFTNKEEAINFAEDLIKEILNKLK